MAILPKYIVVNPNSEQDIEEQELRILKNGKKTVEYLSLNNYLKEDEKIIIYGERRDAFMQAFAGTKYIDPMTVTKLQASEFKWNWSLFIESKKAEGFEMETGIRLREKNIRYFICRSTLFVKITVSIGPI